MFEWTGGNSMTFLLPVGGNSMTHLLPVGGNSMIHLQLVPCHAVTLILYALKYRC